MVSPTGPKCPAIASPHTGGKSSHPLLKLGQLLRLLLPLLIVEGLLGSLLCQDASGQLLSEGLGQVAVETRLLLRLPTLAATFFDSTCS